jgi:hypothetical protein
MADYRKSFNFRNGVQVDNDNLVVNSNGLVGVGTTVPTEVLDVRGTARIVGLATADQLNSKTLNVSGVTTLTSASIGNLSISSSGIITAVSGVVTFYGDGSTLSNIPTSQWVDVDVGLGFTSIYAAGNVGVGTTDPRSTLQIGGNPETQSGIGINSTGDINATGIITATDFYGTLRGRVKGDVNSTGVSTFTDLKVGTVTVSGGIITATTFIGNLTGDVVGIATTARGLTGTPDINVGIITATKIVTDSIIVNATPSGITTVSKLLHVGTGGTSFTALSSGRIGVGTALPTSEIQVRKASGSLVEVVSDSGQARISVGQSVGAGNSSAVLRFGNSAGVLDIVNNDVGDVKTTIHGGTGAGSTGNFKWVYGQTNAERMTLTWDGKLGVNQSSPENTLHVVGTSTVTGNAWIGGNLNVSGNIVGNITLDSILTNTNLNNTSGITTLSQLNVTNDVDFGSASLVGLGNTVAIGTDSGSTDYGLVVNNGIRASEIEVNVGGINANSGVVTAFNFVASGGFRSSGGLSTSTQNIQIEHYSSPDRIVFTVVGIGSTSLQLF